MWGGDFQVKWEVISLKHYEFRGSHWQTILLLCMLVRWGIIRKSHIKLLQLLYKKWGQFNRKCHPLQNVDCLFFSIKPSHQRGSSSCEKTSCHWCSQMFWCTKLSMCCLASKMFCFLFFFYLHTQVWNMDCFLLVRMTQGLIVWH